jgi:hypothetical protein
MSLRTRFSSPGLSRTFIGGSANATSDGQQAFRRGGILRSFRNGRRSAASCEWHERHNAVGVGTVPPIKVEMRPMRGALTAKVE